MGQPFQNGDDKAFEEGEISVISHEDSGDLITRVSVKSGLSFEESADLISEIQESSGSGRAAPSAHIIRMIKRGMRIVLESRTNKELAIKGWCFCLAMGWFDIIDGIDSSTRLAAKLHVTKADVNKFVCMFRDIVPDGMSSLPPTAGQRSDKARATFARTRHMQESMRGMAKKVGEFIDRHTPKI
jgi:hypothetical protein